MRDNTGFIIVFTSKLRCRSSSLWVVTVRGTYHGGCSGDVRVSRVRMLQVCSSIEEWYDHCCTESLFPD
jgi:hypothetical protein